MKSKILIILFFGLGHLQAQTKKEQIIMLNKTIDSLNNILVVERNNYSLNQKESQKLIDSHKKDIEIKNALIKNLDNRLEISNQKADSIVNVLSKEIIILKDSLRINYNKKQSNFILQYQHSKVIDVNENKELTTVFLNFKNKHYIITDSIVSKINETELCFYFLTPLEDEINVQCPYDFGIIVIDRDNNEIYTSFWNVESNLELKGNCLPSINHYKSTNVLRNILCLGNSGCGSGIDLTYFDIKLVNNKIQFKEVFSCGGGYSDFQFIPEKNIYLKIERINPECHYSCPSKYKISTYSLSNDLLLNSNLTKSMYDDYNDIGIEALLKKIKIKEPNIIY
jgi:hypothetical protein